MQYAKTATVSGSDQHSTRLVIYEAHTRLAMQTIGFGDFHPETTEAKWCALLFVPIVVAATGYILGK